MPTREVLLQLFNSSAWQAMVRLDDSLAPSLFQSLVDNLTDTDKGQRVSPITTIQLTRMPNLIAARYAGCCLSWFAISVGEMEQPANIRVTYSLNVKAWRVAYDGGSYADTDTPNRERRGVRFYALTHTHIASGRTWLSNCEVCEKLNKLIVAGREKLTRRTSRVRHYDKLVLP
jgi:hypothetical protein